MNINMEYNPFENHRAEVEHKDREAIAERLKELENLTAIHEERVRLATEQAELAKSDALFSKVIAILSNHISFADALPFCGTILKKSIVRYNSNITPRRFRGT